jgi:RNA recognition motif-containing protein
MSKKLFVGGLPYSVTNEQLAELFQQVGTVASVNVIVDKYTGQSKGFGFVEMETEEAAQQAIAKLHGYNMGGRTIAVNEARPMEDRGNRRGGGGGGNGGGGGRFERNKRW